jgi:hypothetical protein
MVTEPRLVGTRWIVTATDDTGENVDYGYPTEFAAQDAYAILAKKEGEYHDG